MTHAGFVSLLEMEIHIHDFLILTRLTNYAFRLMVILKCASWAINRKTVDKLHIFPIFTSLIDFQQLVWSLMYNVM